MATTSRERTTVRRSLSVWQAVGISVALMATYVFYALVTSSAAGIFGSAFLEPLGIWTNQPDWAGFLVGGMALVLALLFAVVPARRAGAVLLSVEGITVALILVIAVVVLLRLLAGNAPNRATFTLSVFTVEPGTDVSTSSASSSDCSRSRGSRRRPRWARRPGTRAATSHARSSARHLRRRLLHRRHGHRDDGVHPDRGGRQGVHRLARADGGPGNRVHRPLGRRPHHPRRSGIGVRLLPGLRGRSLPPAVRDQPDLAPGGRLARTGSSSTPAPAALVIATVVVLIALVCALAFGATPFDTFLWSGTIGTLILLVAYVLATVGCLKLIWVDKRMDVPGHLDESSS